ncbi:uncharacterized protein LOC130614154 [Hydractinia symbiolongicarpus]|uniref:uncharacterized protein LOC130614154 n=1 Tax=Hydractinia symbiolongicarpus TaxID=13093 RepID=UPI00254F14A0|nr:uncharacterized protein LOC130614154 [Hydractinia symbiolongicarpus]
MNRMKLLGITLLVTLVKCYGNLGFYEINNKVSEPVVPCYEHPAYGEEPELFVHCPQYQMCYFYPHDEALNLGSFCRHKDFTTNGHDGEGEEEQRPVEYDRT